MQVNNPFVYHVPVAPANFVGRGRILSLIFSQLRSSSRANIALCGPLGIGKTSLLDYIADPEVGARWGLDRDRYLVCKIDCQSLGDFTPDRFWRRLLRCMSRASDGSQCSGCRGQDRLRRHPGPAGRPRPARHDSDRFAR